MREKLIALTFVIIIVLTSIPIALSVEVKSNESEQTTKSALPDLILDVSFIERENGYHYTKMVVKNIGDAPAIPTGNYTVKVSSYPFGIYPVHEPLMKIFFNLPDFLFVLFVNVVILKLHIYPLPTLLSEGYFYDPLYPNKTETRYAMLPMDQEADDYFNAKICIVTETVVDYFDTIKESNETNNKKIIRWWLPNIMNPPKPD